MGLFWAGLDVDVDVDDDDDDHDHVDDGDGDDDIDDGRWWSAQPDRGVSVGLSWAGLGQNLRIRNL